MENVRSRSGSLLCGHGSDSCGIDGLHNEICAAGKSARRGIGNANGPAFATRKIRNCN